MVRALAGDSTMTRGFGMAFKRFSRWRPECQTCQPAGLDPRYLLETFGTLGLLAIVFAETGLLVGFFLPGDSLLVLAGLFCAVADPPVHLHLWLILPGLVVAALAGAQTGHYIGLRAGPVLFRRPDSRFFKHEYVEQAQAYFDRYGAKTIVVARFIPIVRTF